MNNINSLSPERYTTIMPFRWSLKALAFTALGLTCAALYSPLASAKVGDGGFVNIEAKSGTNSISVSNDGTKYYIIDQPFNLGFRISGGSGKHRTTESLVATIGRWEFKVPGNKGASFSKSLEVLEVFNPNEITKQCEQKLTLAAANQNKTKDTLRNNGWKTSFDYMLQYQGELYFNNPPLMRQGLGNQYRDQDVRKIIIQCLGHTRTSDPRPNKKTKEESKNKPPRETKLSPTRETSSKRKPRHTTSAGGLNEKTAQNAGKAWEAVAGNVGTHDTTATEKASSNVTIKGKKILQNTPTANTDKIAAKPAADLYPITGGFSDENQMDWVLVTGNQGNAASKATKISIYLETISDKVAIGELPLPALTPGQSHELIVNSLLPVSSIKTLYAHIDRPNIISERDEKNNQLYFKTAENADQRLILVRKRPGRTTYGGIQASEMTYSGDEHEIEYDVASGAFKFKSKT